MRTQPQFIPSDRWPKDRQRWMFGVDETKSVYQGCMFNHKNADFGVQCVSFYVSRHGKEEPQPHNTPTTRVAE